ncbi:MAG: metal-dependent transcriptional regulator [Candidatus Poribacteria bacterium]
MRINEASQEILEKLWTALEEDNKDNIRISDLGLDKKTSELNELIDAKLVSTSSDILELTSQGRREAEIAIRRHRLAERLLNDVLETKQNVLEENACEFEHFIHEGIDENICTLLGHPKVCPHGKPIPPGECCRKGKDMREPVVSALADLNPGQSGRIAYVLSSQSNEVQKLVAMGILPGTSISLIQRYPSYVFEVGNTQYAVDRNIANQIYVRIENHSRADEALSLQESQKSHHNRRKGWMFR